MAKKGGKRGAQKRRKGKEEERKEGERRRKGKGKEKGAPFSIFTGAPKVCSEFAPRGYVILDTPLLIILLTQVTNCYYLNRNYTTFCKFLCVQYGIRIGPITKYKYNKLMGPFVLKRGNIK